MLILVFAFSAVAVAVFAFIASFTLALAIVMITTAMLFLVARNILVVIPTILYKINGLTASTVFLAVLAPVFRVAGRYVHVYRWPCLTRWWSNYRWFRIDQRGPREIADFYVPIKARLADGD